MNRKRSERPFPKIGLTVGQYAWYWLIILLLVYLPEGQKVSAGLFIYLYHASTSMMGVGLLMIYNKKNVISHVLCLLEISAILLILPALWANLSFTPNWFHTHFGVSLEYLFLTEIAILTLVGLYGFFSGLVRMACRRPGDHRDNNYRESLLQSFF
jgi:hypothetical protein